jgi:hypothetical protein
MRLRLSSLLSIQLEPIQRLVYLLDRDTGLSLPGQMLLTGEPGESAFRPKTAFDKPVRILIQVQFHENTRKRLQIEIGEFVTKGEVEVLEGPALQWRNGGLAATSQKVYSRLGRLRVRGLGRKDRVVIRTVDLTSEDHTLLLPIWAGIPEQLRVQSMLIRSILEAERFDRPFGLPALPTLPNRGRNCGMSVHLPWNSLIGEGLLSYGFRAEAVRLTMHLMNAVIQSLKQNRCFHQRYHAETGAGIGERNSLGGFAPVGLFLRCLGVTILSAEAVRLEGRNLFPWPVTLNYKGLLIVRGMEETTITFPNGVITTVKDTAPTIVSL